MKRHSSSKNKNYSSPIIHFFIEDDHGSGFEGVLFGRMMAFDLGNGSGSFTAREMAEFFGVNLESMRKALGRFFKRGRIKKVAYGRWQVTQLMFEEWVVLVDKKRYQVIERPPPRGKTWKDAAVLALCTNPKIKGGIRAMAKIWGCTRESFYRMARNAGHVFGAMKAFFKKLKELTGQIGYKNLGKSDTQALETHKSSYCGEVSGDKSHRKRKKYDQKWINARNRAFIAQHRR